MPITNIDLRKTFLWRLLVPVLITAVGFCSVVSFLYHDLRGFFAAMLH